MLIWPQIAGTSPEARVCDEWGRVISSLEKVLYIPGMVCSISVCCTPEYGLHTLCVRIRLN